MLYAIWCTLHAANCAQAGADRAERKRMALALAQQQDELAQIRARSAHVEGACVSRCSMHRHAHHPRARVRCRAHRTLCDGLDHPSCERGCPRWLAGAKRAVLVGVAQPTCAQLLADSRTNPTDLLAHDRRARCVRPCRAPPPLRRGEGGRAERARVVRRRTAARALPLGLARLVGLSQTWLWWCWRSVRSAPVPLTDGLADRPQWYDRRGLAQRGPAGVM